MLLLNGGQDVNIPQWNLSRSKQWWFVIRLSWVVCVNTQFLNDFEYNKNHMVVLICPKHYALDLDKDFVPFALMHKAKTEF